MSKRPTNKNNNLFIETNDDGGAAKGNDRLYRRKRRRIIEVISIPLGFIIIIGFLIQVQHHLNDKMASKRMRNKDYLDQMKKNFRIENTKNNNRNTNNIINSNEGKPGYGRKQPLKKYRWIDLRQLPPLDNGRDWIKKYLSKDSGDELRRNNGEGFRVRYGDQQLWWETLAEQLDVGENIKNQSPTVDYTKMKYTYPDPMLIPPEDGSYPPMVTMEALFDKWPQENIDSPPNPFVETLQHFDFGDPQQVEAAIKYRDLELPFKVYNIPEIDAAGQKWTDDYLSYHFDRTIGGLRGMFTNTKKEYDYMPPSSGKAQYSLDSFFAFFNARNWSIEKMGPPPTLDTDLTFEKWAKHARYADAVGLEPNQVHYYWQSGVSRSERTRSKDRWTMISNDLPSFSSPEPTFFSFNPEEQKGIQCRFGERVSDDTYLDIQCMCSLWFLLSFFHHLTKNHDAPRHKLISYQQNYRE